MNKLFLIFLPAAFILSTALAFTYADDPLDALLASLIKFTKEYPQEKVHLQLDKPYYSLGEDIWFKAYVVNAERNILSSQSKILYVDLIDDRDSVKKTLLLPLVNGMASANIHLSDSVLNAGNYHLYAYTKWMTNYGSDYYFKKSVTIVNALRDITASITYKSNVGAADRQLTAEVSYLNKDGSPLINQSITYKLSVKGKSVADGKATTDANGKITVNGLIKEEYKAEDVAVNTTINIVSPSRGSRNYAHDFVIKPLANVAAIQFFPEGGRLVNGIRTKVGFKALKPDGLGEDITGYIADENNEHVAEFKSEHAGMGIFALMPAAGKTYTAFIKHENGSEKRYPLPKADDNGYVLNINHVGKDSLSIRIAASPQFVTSKEVALVAQSNGIIQFAAKVKLDKALNVSYIPVNKFPTGITQFTLFSPEYAPVAERLTFIEHNDQLSAEIKTDQTTYAKRGKVKMDIKVTDALGEPVVGSFSVAVTDNNTVKTMEDNETTIMSDLLLTSDIKGYIEHPNYYFNSANADRLKHLDQLLLTQGWRRFSWANLQANKYPVIKYAPEQALSVNGTITTLGNKPISKGKVTLFAATANGPLLIDTVADNTGHFVFDNLNFADSTKLVVRASNAKSSSNVKIVLDRKPHIPFASAFDAAAVTDAGLSDYLKFTQGRFDEMSKFGLFNNAVALKEVTVTSKKLPFFANRVIPNSVNISPGTADQVIKKEELTKETNLLWAFYGKTGIEIKNDMVYRVGHLVSLTRPQGEPMLVLLDGAELPPSSLKELNVSSVAGVEILTAGSNTAIYGDRGYWGVILITSKRGGEDDSGDSNSNVAHFIPKGYSATKQFYTPVYDAEMAQTKMADLRSTIYWEPNMITDAQGNATATYFNADNTGTYKVTLEGLDTKGKLARKIYTYMVK